MIEHLKNNEAIFPEGPEGFERAKLGTNSTMETVQIRVPPTKMHIFLDEPHIYTLRERAAPEQHEPEELPFLEPTLDEAPGGQPLGFKFQTDYQSPSISFC